MNLADPELAIRMGHGIVTDENGNIVKSINNLEIENKVYITLKDGKLKSVIKGIDRRES